MLKSLVIAFSLVFISLVSRAQFLDYERMMKNYELDEVVEVLDVDGDGLKDLICYANPGAIFYRKNLGTEFGLPQVLYDSRIDLNGMSESMVLQDAEGDGDIDIIFPGISKLVVLRNHNYTFITETFDLFSPSGWYYDIKQHDGDLDGDLDLYLYRNNWNKVYVYENVNGNFAFSDIVSNSGGNISTVNFIDFDHDGNKDLIVQEVGSAGEVNIIGYAGGLDYSGVLYNYDPNTNSNFEIEVVDFDGDGDDDLMSAYSCATFIENLGPSNFAPEVSNGCSHISPSFGDLNNDNLPDAVSFDSSDDSLRFYVNIGDSLVKAFALKLELNNYNRTYIRDFNGDGLNDVLTKNQYHTINVYLNLGGMQFDLYQSVESMAYPDADYLHQWGNINTDNVKDFMAVDQRFPLQGLPFTVFKFFFNPLDTNSFTSFIPDDSSIYSTQHLVDLDGDNLSDIAVTDAFTDDVLWMKNNGGSFSQPVLIAASSAPFTVSPKQTVQDLDFDGDYDILKYLTGPNQFEFLLNDGTGNFVSEIWDLPFNFNENKPFVALDLGNDSIIDFAHWDNGPDELNVIISGTGNNYTSIVTIDSLTSIIPKIGTDLNNDGIDELIVKGNINQHWIVHVNPVDSSYYTSLINPSANGEIDFIEDDFNGDSFPELIGLQTLNSVLLFPNDSGNVYDYQVLGPTIHQSNSIYFFDIDKDSDKDLLLYDVGTGVYGIQENIGLSRFSFSGSYFIDMDQNGLFDSTDFPMTFGSLELSSIDNSYTFWPNGQFWYYVDSSDYTLTSAENSDPFWVHTTDSVFSFTLDGNNLLEDSLNIGVWPSGPIGICDVTPTDLGCVGINGIIVQHTIIGANNDLIFELKLDSNMVLDSVYFNYDSISTNSLYWSLTNPDPYLDENDYLTFHFSGSQSFEFAELIYNIYEDDGFGNLTLVIADTLLQRATCSYDPNEKIGTPYGITQEHYIEDNQKMEYIVYFQNTGTDTAHNVLLTDQLGPYFDHSSLHFISSSHPCNLILEPDNMLIVEFDNIDLPDSNVNELESHGFVKFELDLLDDIPGGTLIENEVAIYFDFNNAVYTNKAFHTIYECEELSQKLSMGSVGCENQQFDGNLDNMILLDSVVWKLDGNTISNSNNFSTDTISVGTHTIEISAYNPFCQLDSTVIFEVFSSHSDSTQANVCTGDSIIISGQSYYSAGIYIDSMQTIQGCDSVSIIEIYEQSLYFDTTIVDICSGDSALLYGQTYYSAGIYVDSMQTIQGCDSLQIVQINEFPIFLDTIQANICLGDSIEINGQIYSSSGTFIDSLQSVQGCDSVYVIEINAYNIYLDTTIADICLGDSVSWNGQTYFAAGTYIDSLQSVQGCDSIFVIEIIEHPSFLDSIEAEICAGDSIVINGQTYFDEGIYIDTLQTTQGCDSTFVVSISEVFIDIALNQSLDTLVAVPGAQSYQWLNCLNGMSTIIGATDDTLITGLNGEFAVIITEGSCIDTSACIVVEGLNIVNNTFEELIVYPNPTQGKIWIDFAKTYEKINCTLTAPNGEIVYQKQLFEISLIELNVEYNDGVYFLNLDSENGESALIKIVKQ